MMEGRDSCLERVDESIMADELYKAAFHDEVEFFDNITREKGEAESYFLKKTWKSNNNILHIAIRCCSWRFAREAHKRFPDLIWDSNLDGDTPLHLALGIVLHPNRDYGSKLVKEVCGELIDKRPWRIQNSRGNTLLHVALIHNQYYLALYLLEKDPCLVEIVNNHQEAPLHLALQHFSLDDEAHLNVESIAYNEERFTKMMEDDLTNWTEIYNNQERFTHWTEFLNDQISREDRMGVLIRILLEKGPNVVRWRDTNGLSPLYRVVLLPTIFILPLVKYMIQCCPQSIEDRDSTGKTILHHLVNRVDFDASEGDNLLRNTLIYGLVNHQDEQGNTAGHLAAMNDDINMLRAILEMPNFNQRLRNKEGLSTITLAHLHDLVKMLGSPRMTRKMCKAAEAADVQALLKINESLQDIDRIERRQDSKGRNIFHKLFEIKWGQLIIPEHMFSLLYEYVKTGINIDVGDNNGDTPTHILAQHNPNNIMISLGRIKGGPYEKHFPPSYRFRHHAKQFYYEYDYEWTNLGGSSYYNDLINWWMDDRGPIPIRNHLTQNANGNTALHEALLAKNYPLFIKLAEFKDGATALVNKRQQTLLHLLVSLNPIPQIKDDAMTNIIKNNTEEGRRLCNEDGVSLVTLAIEAGNIEFAAKLCSVRPTIAAFVDPFKGQTFWHKLVDLPPIQPSFNFAESSFTDEAVFGQLATKDKQGQTALHLAIERRRFDLAQTFLGLGGKLYSNGTPVFQDHLLKMPNTEGITPADMIGELPYVPPQFEEFIGRVSTIIGIRSIWGIPSTQMKDYVNTMGVIAALLTTITFTAAFAVPGGFDQEKGIPLLMKETSFQVFIFFDIIAMCLSMMVLFCLLWIMATGDRSKALILLDFSIILLQLSFYTTLVTFMTGLYATTHAVKLWVAVIVLVSCSMLMMLMQKWLVMKFIIPSGKAVLIYIDKGYRYTKKLRKRINKIYRRQRSSSRPVLPISSH